MSQTVGWISTASLVETSAFTNTINVTVNARWDMNPVETTNVLKKTEKMIILLVAKAAYLEVVGQLTITDLVGKPAS